jgi:hypothetical protein
VKTMIKRILNYRFIHSSRSCFQRYHFHLHLEKKLFGFTKELFLLLQNFQVVGKGA